MAAPMLVPVAIMGGTVALIGGIAYAGVLGERKRNAAMQEVAARMGFSYEETCEPDTLGTLTGNLPVFGRGHSRKARRLMRGKVGGRNSVLLDYCFTTGGG